MCMKDAEFSAIVCFACFQILWWNAERTFLTPFTTPPPRLVFYVPCLSNYRSLRSKLKPCMCRISPSVFSSRKVSHKMSSGEAWFHLILVLYDKYWHLQHVSNCIHAEFTLLSCSSSEMLLPEDETWYTFEQSLSETAWDASLHSIWSYSWHSLSNAW